jgi:hypothetical protein
MTAQSSSLASDHQDAATEPNDVIVAVLEPGQTGEAWIDRARRVLFVAPPGGRPDRFVTYPHNYFEAPLGEPGITVFAHRVLAWFKPSAVHAAGPSAEPTAQRIRTALAGNGSAPVLVPDRRLCDDPRPRVVLVHRHIADVLYDGPQSLVPEEISLIYVSHALGGLDAYDPDAFHRTFICDFLDQEETRVVCDWVVEQYNADRVVALHEKYVMFTAALRARHGLAGLDVATATRFRDKTVMKDWVRERTRLRVPRFAVVSAVVAFDDFARAFNRRGKVVLKPVDGLGAERTFICHDLDEARARWHEIGAPATGYEIEEFIEGDIYHVDTVVMDGETRLVSVSEYLHPPAAFERGGEFGSMTLTTGSLVDTLVTANAMVLEALGPVSAVTHLEFFVTPEGEVVFCEAAARPGGAGIDRVLVETHGVSAITAALLVESGLDIFPSERRTVATYGWLGFYPDGERSGHLDENLFAELGIIGHKHNAFAGVVNGAPRHSVEFVDRFIIRADNPEQFRELVDCIRGEYRS